MSTLIQDQRLISKIGFSEILKRHVRVLELSVSIILHDCSRSFIDPVQLKSDDFGMHYVLRKNFFLFCYFFQSLGDQTNLSDTIFCSALTAKVL